MVVWSLSFAICGQLSHDVKSMSDDKHESVHMYHKEESLTQIKNDQKD